VLRMSDDELVITVHPENNQDEFIIPEPELPPLPIILTPKMEEIIPDIVKPIETSEPVFKNVYWMDPEFRSFLIHTVCDIILFYLCFRYMNNLFSQTRKSIEECRKTVDELKEQYGLFDA